MKRIISLIALLCFCLGTATVFSSCKEQASVGHEHKFSEEWSKDESDHWKVCGEDGCQVRSSVAAHSFKEDNTDPNSPIVKCEICGYVKSVEDHSHIYGDEYYSNGESHWHRCTKSGCAQKKEIIPHAYGNPSIIQEPNRIIKTDSCVDCGYRTVSVYDISSVIKDSEAWNIAFKTLDLSNYSAKVIKIKNDKTEYNENSVAVADDGAYYCDNGKLEYYTVKNNGVFTTYQRVDYAIDRTAPFVKLSSTSDASYKAAKNGTYMHVSFEDNFEIFEYDLERGEYVCNDDIAATIYNADGSVMEREIYCYGITVRMVDGKINYISMNYYFAEEGRELYTRTLTYYNIGMTNVTLPQEIVENAITPLQ